MLTRAIVRPPAENFGDGLTKSGLGTPNLALALHQHAAYCAMLERCGLVLTRLPADANFPDSTFVEDTAVLTPRGAVITRPGAPSRTAEIHTMRPVLEATFDHVHSIDGPGTLDGGDVCQAGKHFFIGLTARTNRHGAEQLAGILAGWGFTSTLVDVPALTGVLHLKSALSYLGDRRLVATPEIAGFEGFRDYETVRVEPPEAYAANVLRVVERVIMAAGNPRLESAIRALGYPVVTLDMSEFRKMDGALTCLSLCF